MRAAAGIEPKMPRLCFGARVEHRLRNYFHRFSINFHLTHLEINFICGPERIICSVKCDVQMGQ